MPHNVMKNLTGSSVEENCVGEENYSFHNMNLKTLGISSKCFIRIYLQSSESVTGLLPKLYIYVD